MEILGDLRILHLLCLGGVYVLYKLLHQLFLWPYLLSPHRKIPGPPLRDPFLGVFPEIMHAEAGILQRQWVKQYGPVVRAVGPFGVERIIFMKPEALHRILISDWLEYPRPDFMRNILGVVAGYGLLTVTGNEHKQMRKVMNPAFSIPNLMAQTDMYYDSIESLVDILSSATNAQQDPSQGKEFLMYEWMSKVTLDIICETAFGYKTNSLRDPHNELAEAYEHLIGLQSGPNIARFIGLMSIPGAPFLFRSQWAYDHRHWFFKSSLLAPAATTIESMYRIKSISQRILTERLSEAQSSAVNLEHDMQAKKDIMSLLVRARLAGDQANKGSGVKGYRMSDGAVMDQVLTFLGAGHETTASGLAWTLWLLANDPQSQRKLRAEVTPLLDANPRPSYRELKDLQWLDCVVLESLRLMPPVPMTLRKAAKTGTIDGVSVSKGTILYIPIRVVNTWKEIWGDDAEEFNPARWHSLPNTYHPTYSMLSFIAGPHACIGKTMAIIEMKSVLALLVANFEFEPSFPGQIVKPTAAVTMKPADSMPLRVKLVDRM
ncbi:hypothetical protein JAAARDRAFT_181568 [Jaapia argillacea MUCL 33604]|uniref:Cytochrome P450 n=1 Tax=Jaapia argillacea MUCL 33604 TaxID=933084 RepID=A0A067PX07_9AGAM|nr:hypothetical protein JAAARDRAFT_181568 [Jaapia argillacea MUCL 33604]